MATPPHRFVTKSRILLTLVVAIFVLYVAWDWNWFRKPAENYFIERSQRQVSIGDLHVSFNSKLEPTVRLRNLRVENAPWADSRPFVTAGEISFTFALRSISERRPVVSVLRLVNADIDLERQADGHRNWRLRNPENVAKGRMKVVRLEAENSRIRFIRRDNGFEILLASSPLQAPSSNAAGSLTKRIQFQGTMNGAAFSGDAETGDFLTIMESHESFPLRGHVAVGKSRMDVDGSLENLFNPSRAQGKVRLAGISLAQLHPFLPPNLPATRPYEIEATFHHEGDAMTAKDVSARVGATRLTGSLSLDRSRERPLLQAEFKSPSADLADLGWGAKVPRAPREPSPARKEPGKVKRSPLFSDKALPFDKLEVLDAQVKVQLRKLRAAAVPGLESLAFEARLEAGILEVEPNIGIAEGNLKGRARIDGTVDPALVEVKLGGRDMRIEKMLAGKLLSGTTAGPVEAHVDLNARGNSAAALAGSLSGSTKASLQNGVISGLLDATLKLDLGKILRAMFTGNKPIGINRADAEFDFAKGKGTARVFFVDTQQTRIVGTGYIDLHREALDMVLTPHPVKKGLFALDSAIHVHGPIKGPKVGLAKKDQETSENVASMQGPKS